MSKCEKAAQSKILVFATQKNPLAARISIALASAGFRVAALTPHGHPVRETRRIREHFTHHACFRLKSIIRAIDRWSPDLLACTDDPAVRELLAIQQRAVATDDKTSRKLADLIERSLGPPTSFTAIRNKSDFLALAELEGLRCPKTIVLPATGAFESAAAELSYPIVVKADHSDGGRCVRIVNKEADFRAAVWELQTPCTWRCRRFFGAMLGSRALRLLNLPLRRTISLQEYIVGRPSNRAVICWKGKVLAGISVEAIEVLHDRGPASVVRLIDHLEMATACERMVKRLNLSGFVGFDFILDSANRAWLLEMNPRVTQICHFLLADGTSLAASLYTQMKRQLPPSIPGPIHGDLVALFPNEMLRCPSSTYLQSSQHDVPWEELELVRSVLNQALGIGVLKRTRVFLERHFPQIAGLLLELGIIDDMRERESYSPSRPKEITPPV